ncbi:FAD-dependent oxidoreductase [Sedimenticola thiotaurini]|uniref:FAD-dependent oxidoreductase n=1 Tax=Sedimenticola thiotaurini TaxID=1543721 RepID=A0A0F7JZ41_9GAMM|nr:FAD-dependent oxidoreductase [Sedimenticola thiotaurini]AKH19963.1 FAD-dependent oxidoreductase [Sedimenticola thiotaurini]
MQWQLNQVHQTDHSLPVLTEVDVVVVGGGAAGIAAAVTSAQRGLKTLLVERYGFCGGAAVAGLSGTICGMYLSTDALKSGPEQVVFGFTERFRAAMALRNGITDPQLYGKTWTVTHDPLVWREVGEGLLIDAGVQMLYHTQVIGVIKEDDTLHGVVLNSKSGIGAVHAKVVIDASGDADVVARAGYSFKLGDDGHIQNPTMIFRLAGVDTDRFKAYWGDDTISSQKVIKALIEADSTGGYELPRSKIWIFETPRPGELLINATRVLGRDGRDLNVLDPVDHTEAEQVGRGQAREYARFLRDQVPGCEASFINDTGVEVGIRQTRSIVGVETLSDSDVVNRRKRADGVVRSPWPIEMHNGQKPTVEWLLDDYYEVPYGALVPAQGENLLVAGRCLSAQHQALASARVTAQCFGYGHAAGIAAVTAIRERIPLRAISGEQIRALLNEDGAALD